MNKYDPAKDIAFVIANTKRKTRPHNIIEVAEALERLVNHYDSMDEVGKIVDLSWEMVREFLTALKLPREVKEIIRERKIDKIDVVRKIAALEDDNQKIIAAKALADSTSDEVRDILRLVKTTGVSIDEAKRIVLEAKPKGFHIFMMDFNDEIYRLLLEAAKKRKVRPAELARDIITDWLRGNNLK